MKQMIDNLENMSLDLCLIEIKARGRILIRSFFEILKIGWEALCNAVTFPRHLKVVVLFDVVPSRGKFQRRGLKFKNPIFHIFLFKNFIFYIK